MSRQMEKKTVREPEAMAQQTALERQEEAAVSGAVFVTEESREEAAGELSAQERRLPLPSRALVKEAEELTLAAPAETLAGGAYLQRALRQLERGSGTMRREQSIVIRQSAVPDEENTAPALEISRLFERDARRYDGEFMLYD